MSATASRRGRRRHHRARRGACSCSADRRLEVTLFEAADTARGQDPRPHRSPALEHVDEGADAFLARVPHASHWPRRSASRRLVSPDRCDAAVWHDGLHPIPDGIVLGVPGQSSAGHDTTCSHGAARPAPRLEPFLPRTRPTTTRSARSSAPGSATRSTTPRRRPRRQHLRRRHRPLSLARGAPARRARRRATQPAARPPPSRPRRDRRQRHRRRLRRAARRDGRLVDATASVTAARAVHRDRSPVDRDRAATAARWRVDGRPVRCRRRRRAGTAGAGALVASARRRCRTARPHRDRRRHPRHAARPRREWPDRLHGRADTWCRSPSAVESPPCRSAPRSGRIGGRRTATEILRVSLGRDGTHRSTISTTQHSSPRPSTRRSHLGSTCTRAPASLAGRRVPAVPAAPSVVAEVDAACPRPDLAGASYRGIGIPACIDRAHGRAVAHARRSGRTE